MQGTSGRRGPEESLCSVERQCPQGQGDPETILSKRAASGFGFVMFVMTMHIKVLL